MRLLRLTLLITLIAGCQTIANVPPGAGKKEVVVGHTYDQVWGAAYQVAAKHLVVKEQYRAAGRILAEEPISVWSYADISRLSLFISGTRSMVTPCNCSDASMTSSTLRRFASAPESSS